MYKNLIATLLLVLAVNGISSYYVVNNINEGQEILVRKSNSLEEEALVVLKLLGEFNDDLTSFNNRVTAVENRKTFIPDYPE